MSFPSRRAGGWLVACTLACLFVLMGASGDDVYARHVGMSVSTVATSTTTVQAEVRRGVQDPARISDIARAESQRTMDELGAPAHVMHMLGACLAVLALAVLLHVRGSWYWPTKAVRARAARPAYPASWLACVRRGPPLLDPPRSSPVIRT